MIDEPGPPIPLPASPEPVVAPPVPSGAEVVSGGTEHFGGNVRQTAEVGNPEMPETGGWTRAYREGIRQGILQILDDLDRRIAPPAASFADQLALFQASRVAPTPREELPETTTVKYLPADPEGAYLLGVAELRERLRMRTDDLLTRLAHGVEPWNG